MLNRDDFKIKIYADGADIAGMKEMYGAGFVSGFTTNPTLMKKAGVKDYEVFCRQIAAEITDLPLCFEVFADEFDEMARQAQKIGSWGENILIKIPITNTRGQSSVPLIRELSGQGLKLNITAMLTLAQVESVLEVLNPKVNTYISVFAGRIADVGTDPCPILQKTAELCRAASPQFESLWCSTRELYNIFQAQACGVHIITVTNDILKKMPLIGKDLTQLSLETVKMFYDDAQKAGYCLYNRFEVGANDNE